MDVIKFSQDGCSYSLHPEDMTAMLTSLFTVEDKKHWIIPNGVSRYIDVHVATHINVHLDDYSINGSLVEQPKVKYKVNIEEFIDVDTSDVVQIPSHVLTIDNPL